MITPRFFCTQTADSVVVSIYCPSVRAAEVEIHVDETLLSVHIAPYFLRVNFPGNVVEDDDSSAVYDPSTGYLTVTLTKESKGVDFPDLDLLAKLLAPKPVSKDAPRGPLIEVIASHDAGGDADAESERNADADGDAADAAEQDLVDRAQGLSLDDANLTPEQREILQAAANDWQLPQKVPEDLPPLQTSVQKRYGFLDAYTGYFRHVGDSENEVNELGVDAETMSLEERRKRRIQHEELKWDEEYYMADFVEDEYINELLHWTHPILASPEVEPFTEAENLAMLRLPRKEYLATPEQTHSLYLTLATLLFSYTYDARTTQQDPTPESAWTICTLTPAFSALDPPPYPSPSPSPSADLATTFAASYRRALAFPLHRSWALTEACRTDVAGVLQRGTRAVVRCLLALRAILDAHDVYYVYSRVWMDDFCAWAAACASEERLKALGKAVGELKMEKRMTGWDLEELEEAVRAADSDRASDSDDESEDEVERMMPAVLS
ncbi:SHQ1-domain-containing protein [Dentipellis sp. KUC8613]|nr:SHQ1-domain-containing protein [Dentipellis sp. KUC8613]